MAPKLPETDTDGKAEADVPSGRLRLWIPPAHLRTEEARRRLVASEGREALQKLMIGPDGIEARRNGATPVITIRLPANAGY